LVSFDKYVLFAKIAKTILRIVRGFPMPSDTYLPKG
jgi:hypothetical protein